MTKAKKTLTGLSELALHSAVRDLVDTAKLHCELPEQGFDALLAAAFYVSSTCSARPLYTDQERTEHFKKVVRKFFDLLDGATAARDKARRVGTS